eukprot:jgi/Tetstr1/459730/TSEL_005083.t1
MVVQYQAMDEESRSLTVSNLIGTLSPKIEDEEFATILRMDVALTSSLIGGTRATDRQEQWRKTVSTASEKMIKAAPTPAPPEKRPTYAATAPAQAGAKHADGEEELELNYVENANAMDVDDTAPTAGRRSPWKSAAWAVVRQVEVGRPGGMYTNALLVGEQGLPLITYYEPANATLRAAACADPLCRGITTAVVASGGRSHSTVEGRGGLPWIAYCQADPGTGRQQLAITRCGEATCSGRHPHHSHVLDPDGCSLYTSLALGPQGLPIVAYYRRGGHADGGDATWLAACLDEDCADATHHRLQAADSSEPLDGAYASIALQDGLPLISLALRQSHGGAEPVLAACSDALCREPLALTSLAPTTTEAAKKALDVHYTAMTVSAAAVNVLYFEATSESAFIASLACSRPGAGCELRHVSLVDDKIGPVYGEFPHGAMSPLDGGLPAFPYTRQTNRTSGTLMLASCLAPDCSAVAREAVADGGCGFGRDASVAFDAQRGLAYIAFMDYSPHASKRAARLAVLQRTDGSQEERQKGFGGLNKFGDIC